MDERDEGVLLAASRLFVNQPRATISQRRQRGLDIFHDIGDVVNAGPPFVDELTDG